MSYSLFLKKENFKFAAAHFTIFDSQTAETLHGHNYQVGVKMDFLQIKKDVEMLSPFSDIKKIILSVCESLDEKILIPEKSPYLKIQASKEHPQHSDIIFAQRHYRFPDSDLLKLPLANITSEALARYVALELEYRLPKDIQRITVSIKESSGQIASYQTAKK